MKKEYTKEEFDALIEERVSARMRMAKDKFEALVAQRVKEADMTPDPRGPKLGNPEYHGDDDVVSKSATFKSLVADEEVPMGRSGFKGLREFLATVAKSPGDDRLVPASKAMTEADPESAGYLIPTEYANQLITIGIETARIFPLCQSMRMTAAKMNVPVAASLDESGGLLYGGISYGWVDELGTKPEKELKLCRVELEANVAAALIRASNQVLEDSSPRGEAVINDLFGRAWGNTLDDCVLRGIGAAQPLGIIAAPGTYVVAKESGQAASTINLKNVQKMWARLHPASKESSVLRWFINDECVEQITSLALPVGTGGAPAFLISGDAVRPIPKSLFGIPIVWTSHASSLGSKGDIILADLNAWLLGIRRELTAAVSIHLHFDTNETTFRFEARVDGQPILPTTTKSRTGFEQSPFVVLADRS